MRYNTIALDRIGSSYFSFLSRPNYFLVWIDNDSIRCLLGGSFFSGMKKASWCFDNSFRGTIGPCCFVLNRKGKQQHLGLPQKEMHLCIRAPHPLSIHGCLPWSTMLSLSISKDLLRQNVRWLKITKSRKSIFLSSSSTQFLSFGNWRNKTKKKISYILRWVGCDRSSNIKSLAWNSGWNITCLVCFFCPIELLACHRTASRMNYAWLVGEWCCQSYQFFSHSIWVF